MPCAVQTYGNNHNVDRDISNGIEIVKLTQMLCSVLRTVESLGAIGAIKDDGVLKWWDQHQEQDVARIKMELNMRYADAFERRVLFKILKEEFEK